MNTLVYVFMSSMIWLWFMSTIYDDMTEEWQNIMKILKSI